jgi:hypothetical protein
MYLFQQKTSEENNSYLKTRRRETNAPMMVNGTGLHCSACCGNLVLKVQMRLVHAVMIKIFTRMRQSIVLRSLNMLRMCL